MVFKCSVQNCCSKNKDAPKVSLFSFPVTEEMKQKWIDAIRGHERHFVAKYTSKICELHFLQDDIVRETVSVDADTGHLRRQPMRHPHIKKTAVPCVFSSDPEEIATVAPPKLMFHTYEELQRCLDDVNVHEDWTVARTDSAVSFLIINLDVSSVPDIKICATIDADLKMKVFIQKIVVKRIGKRRFPRVCNSIGEIFEVLDLIKNLLYG